MPTLRPGLLLVLLALLLALLPAAPALADTEWCEDDPIVSINGTLVYIGVAVPRSSLAAVSGPVKVVVTVPLGVQANVVAISRQYFQEEVTITYASVPWKGGPIPVLVSVTIPGSRTFPTRTTVTVPSTGQFYATYGVSNEAMTTRFAIANTQS